jgi:hypothetical protein
MHAKAISPCVNCQLSVVSLLLASRGFEQLTTVH